MKKTISCILSCLLLLQNLAYAQAIYPSAKETEDIYNKVSKRINSSQPLKEIIKDKKITPVLALSVIASGGVKIETKEDLAALLEKFNIPAKQEASVLDLYDAAYQELERARAINELIIDHTDQIYIKSYEFVNQVKLLEPLITEYYIKYMEIESDIILQKNLKDLAISVPTQNYTLADLQDAKSLFEGACARAEVEPQKFIANYKNMTKYSEAVEELFSEEELLTKFVRQLSVFKGNFLAQRDIINAGESRERLAQLFKRYVDDFDRVQARYFEQSEYLDELMERIVYSEDPVFCKQVKRFENNLEDLNLKYLESESKLNTVEALCEGRTVRKFTKNGGLFLGILALFTITQNLMKAQDIKNYAAAKNQAENNLQTVIEENKTNLFAFLEALPDKTRKTAFNYIAEDYFDEFKMQTKDLISTLIILENQSSGKSAAKASYTNIENKINQKFDKSYKKAETKLNNNTLRM